jgi:general stress protein YciG
MSSADITGTHPHEGTNDHNPTGGGEHGELTADPMPHPVEETRTAQEGGETKVRRPRGFAAMDRKLVSEIARKGGKAAHTAGTAHEFTSDEARVAGSKGGRATHAKRRKVTATQGG